MVGGGHFLQDGCGDQLAKEVVRFMGKNPSIKANL
jgi:hypothetical protein